MRKALFLLLPLSGCAGRQTPLDPASLQSGQLWSLFQVMLWVCGIAYVLVLSFLGWSIWRARHAMEHASPMLNPGDRGIGRGLWVWGVLVGVGLIVLTVASFLADWSIARAERAGALDIRVTGHQWWWRIQYRDQQSGGWIETANELHLPLGRAAHVSLGSADVIHSFWVPNVAGKMDVIPGRVNSLTLTPWRVGWFRGQCAEFCGSQHAHMAFDVKVESPQGFATWLADQRKNVAAPTDPITAQGQKVVTQGPCAACHTLRGTSAQGRAGPDLTHLASRRMLAAGTLPMSRGGIQGWVAQPLALKPGTSMPAVPLSSSDAKAVSAYLASLQ
jgi:cytochrome c oxidase subunit 2